MSFLLCSSLSIAVFLKAKFEHDGDDDPLKTWAVISEAIMSLLMPLSSHQRNFRKLQWVSGTLTYWNMVCISPITPTSSSLNLSSTLINWFVRSGPGRSSLFKHVQCYIKMLKWFVRSCVTLLDKMFFADLGVGKMFYSSTMLEFDHDDGICF